MEKNNGIGKALSVSDPANINYISKNYLSKAINNVIEFESQKEKTSKIVLKASNISNVLFPLISLGFSISMVVIGAVFLNKCPLNDRIPIWLIVYGCFEFVFVLIGIRYFTLIILLKNSEKRKCCRLLVLKCFSIPLLIAIYVFQFIWLIVGSIWVYSVRDRVSFDEASPEMWRTYCNHTCYYFSFGTITALWVLKLIMFIYDHFSGY